MSKKKEVNIDVKHTLAQLLAVENIQIQHHKINTAAFDVVNRVLMLPIWQDMSDELYCLLIGHEVSHALYTPADELMAAIKIDGEEKKVDHAMKTAINIVEDARIEKMIQKRYPGLRRDFRVGYDELSKERNLFDTPGKNVFTDIAEYKFADRVNIHFKLGSILEVPFFTDKEREIVRKVDSCLTFEDVVRVSRDLLDHLEETQEEQESGDGEGQDGQCSCCDADSFQVSKGDSQSGEGQEICEKCRHKIQQAISDLESQYADKLENLIDKNAKDNVYLSPLKKSYVESAIVPWQEVLKQHKSYYSHFSSKQINFAKREMKKFMAHNKPIVNYMVKEFEQKKAAATASKIYVSKTGAIDTNKLHNYKFKEDLFKRNTYVPEGKNHGLVMFIDFSGSMSRNMSGTIEQLINLVSFCRSVGIHYRVFSFTDVVGPAKHHTDEDNSLKLNKVSFREYLSSEMNFGQYNDAMTHLFAIRNYYTYKSGLNMSLEDTELHGSDISIYRGDDLGGTPLNQALVSSEEILLEFRRRNNIDIVNLIVLTDGEATDDLPCNFSNKSNDIGNFYIRGKRYRDMTRIDMSSSATITKSLVERLTKVTGFQALGFHIIDRLDENFVRSLGKKKDDKTNKLADYQKNGCVNVEGYLGFSDYYFIPGGQDLITKSENDNLDHKNLKKSFDDKMRKDLNSRYILKKFIERISKHF